jgi:excisionase family DNA binding protein
MIPFSDIPPWATAKGSRVHRSREGARRQSDQDEPQSVRTRLRGAGESQEPPPRRSGQRVAAGRAFPLEPLLTVGDTAIVLNVSERTVRRLIASGAIPAVLIGRSDAESRVTSVDGRARFDRQEPREPSTISTSSRQSRCFAAYPNKSDARSRRTPASPSSRRLWLRWRRRSRSSRWSRRAAHG